MSYTCCFVVPVRVGAIAVSVVSVLAGAAFGVVYAKEIEDGMMATPNSLPAARFVPFVSMGSWMVLALISLFGCVASWTAKPRLASAYFWAFLLHYVVDLGFLVVTLFFCIKTAQSKAICPSVSSTASTTPLGHVNVRDVSSGSCPMIFDAASLILLAVLGLYKIYSTFVIYVLFVFRGWAARQALEKEAQKLMQKRPQQEWINYDADTTKNWSKFDD